MFGGCVHLATSIHLGNPEGCNNQFRHSPSTLELKKLKAELEKTHRINIECIKQNLSMQHHRDLQIVSDEAQRRLDNALNQVKSSEEKAIVQRRQIYSLQSQLNQISQIVRQQQQTPTNTAILQHNMTQQHNFSLPSPTHIQLYTQTPTQDMFNLSLNSSLIGVLDKFEKSMVKQNNILHGS